jgi:hypothetical protein
MGLAMFFPHGPRLGSRTVVRDKFALIATTELSPCGWTYTAAIASTISRWMSSQLTDCPYADQQFIASCPPLHLTPCIDHPALDLLPNLNKSNRKCGFSVWVPQECINWTFSLVMSLAFPWFLNTIPSDLLISKNKLGFVNRPLNTWWCAPQIAGAISMWTLDSCVLQIWNIPIRRRVRRG